MARRVLGLLAAAALSLAGLRAFQAWNARQAEGDLAAAEAAMEKNDCARALSALGPNLSRLSAPRRYKALCLRADALDKLKRRQEAVSALEAAVALDPKPWDAPYGLAKLALLDLKNCPAGLKTLDAAMLQPQELYWSKARERVTVYRLRWRCRQALDEVERAIADQGQELALRMQAGETGGEEIRYVLANRAWSNYMLYEKLTARLAKGEWRQIYQEVYGRDPSLTEASDPKKLAEAAPYSHLDQAESDASSALQIRDEPHLRLLRARILVAASKPEPALQDLRVLAASPGMDRNSEYWLIAASAEGQRKNFREALAAVDRSLALDPSNAEAKEMRPVLLDMLKRAPKRRR